MQGPKSDRKQIKVTETSKMKSTISPKKANFPSQTKDNSGNIINPISGASSTNRGTNKFMSKLPDIF